MVTGLMVLSKKTLILIGFLFRRRREDIGETFGWNIQSGRNSKGKKTFEIFWNLGWAGKIA